MYETPKVGFLEAYQLFWKNYVNFKGRSRRSEYWWVALWHFIILIGGGLLSALLFLIPGVGAVIGAAGFIVILAIYPLAIVIPNYALLTRRFHDRGLSMFIPIVSFVLSLVLSLSNVISESRTLYENPDANYKVSEQMGLLSFLPVWLQVLIGLLSILLTLISFVVSLLNSKKETNKYGPSPKYVDNPTTNESDIKHQSVSSETVDTPKNKETDDPYKY